MEPPTNCSISREIAEQISFLYPNCIGCNLLPEQHFTDTPRCDKCFQDIPQSSTETTQGTECCPYCKLQGYWCLIEKHPSNQPHPLCMFSRENLEVPLGKIDTKCSTCLNFSVVCTTKYHLAKVPVCGKSVQEIEDRYEGVTNSDHCPLCKQHERAILCPINKHESTIPQCYNTRDLLISRNYSDNDSCPYCFTQNVICKVKYHPAYNVAISQEKIRQFQQQFKVPFVTHTKFDVLNDFICHIDKCVNHFRNKIVHSKPLSCSYSPYCTLIQSSGYGKTRLALECASKRHVIYLCLRPLHVDGFPLRSIVIADFIHEQQHHGSEFWVRLVFSLAFYYFFQMYPSYPMEPHHRLKWSYKLASEANFQKEFWTNVLTLFHSEDEFPTVFMMNRLRQLRLSELLLIVLDEAASLGSEYVNSSTTIIEQALLTLHSFRLGLQVVGQCINLCGIVLDTDPMIASTIRPDIIKVVARETRHKIHIQLVDAVTYPPYYTLPQYPTECVVGLIMGLQSGKGDVPSLPSSLVKVQETYMVSDMDAAIRCVFYPFLIYLQSRSLFAIRVIEVLQQYHSKHSKANGLSWKTILDDCQTEIEHAIGTLFPLYQIGRPWTDDKLACLACAAIRWSLRIVGSFEKQELMKQYMATCSSISFWNTGTTPDNVDEELNLHVWYPSEPILAEASIAMMYSESKFRNVLLAIRHYLIKGSLATLDTVGEIGVLIYSIILSRAFDLASCKMSFQSSSHVCPPSMDGKAPPMRATSSEINENPSTREYIPYSRIIPLISILKVLFYANNDMAIKRWNTFQANLAKRYPRLAKAVVTFTHFVKVECDMTFNTEYFRECLLRNAAILCNNQGRDRIDIIIPIALVINDLIPIDLFDNATYSISVWIIQVKNWERNVNMRSLIAKMIISSPCEELMGLRSLFETVSDHDGTSTSATSSESYAERFNNIRRFDILFTVVNVAPFVSSDLPGDWHALYQFSTLDYVDWKLKSKTGDAEPNKDPYSPMHKAKRPRKTEQNQHESSHRVEGEAESMYPAIVQSKKSNTDYDYSLLLTVDPNDDNEYTMKTTRSREADATAIDTSLRCEVVVLQLCGLGQGATSNLFPFAMFENEDTKSILSSLRTFHRTGGLQEYHTNFRETDADTVRNIIDTLSPLVKPS